MFVQNIRRFLQSVFGLPRATDFNQSVAMDVHYNNKNLWYFHIIDESSHYSNAVIIRSKHPNIIIKNFWQKTGSAFLGVLRKYLVIMGKGDLFRKNLQISVKTLIQKYQLLWQNHHGVMGYMNDIMLF